MKLHVGHCPTCGHGAAAETDAVVGKATATCTGCGASLVLSAVKGVYAKDVPCDGRCQYAVKDVCACNCGGVNHGRGFITPVGMRPEWVTKRDAQRLAAKADRAAAKPAAARQQRADARAALIEQYPALARLDAHPEAFDGGFITDAIEARDKGVMSERFAEAAVRAVERDEARAAERAARAAREAEVLASGVVAPLGRAEVTGQVVSYRIDDNPYGAGATYKMLVVTDAGWKVWASIPAAIRSAACDEAFAAGKGWGLTMLTGRNVTFTATLAEGKDPDPLFRIGKTPTKATLHPALVNA